jgi:hypothetical protein
MNPNHQAAARALAAGDPLAALPHVALDDSADALALRGVALAQLGDLARAKALLTRALRKHGARQPLARARCVTALAEVALAARELSVPLALLRSAVRALDAHGDTPNALHARLLLARCLMLSGELAGAERAIDDVRARRAPNASIASAERLRGERAIDDVRARRAPPALIASAELLRAELALRRLDAKLAHAALARALLAAERAAIPALSRELAQLSRALRAPAARLIESGQTRLLLLADVERVLARSPWLVDACRRVLRCGDETVSFRRKPVLFSLLRALAEAWPAGIAREQLIARGFGARNVNASHRARLRVELGRLRKLLADVGEVHAEAPGYRLTVRAPRAQVLAPPIDGDDAALMALLNDGASWSTSALALALGVSQRTLQRLLMTLQESGAVGSSGRGRAQRWFAAPLSALGPQVFGLFAYGPRDS